MIQPCKPPPPKGMVPPAPPVGGGGSRSPLWVGGVCRCVVRGSLLVDGPNPFGGGSHAAGGRDHIYNIYARARCAHSPVHLNPPPTFSPNIPSKHEEEEEKKVGRQKKEYDRKVEKDF